MEIWAGKHFSEWEIQIYFSEWVLISCSHFSEDAFLGQTTNIFAKNCMQLLKLIKNTVSSVSKNHRKQQSAVLLRRLWEQISLYDCVPQHCCSAVLFSLMLICGSKTAILKLCTDLFHQCTLYKSAELTAIERRQSCRFSSHWIMMFGVFQVWCLA